MNERVCIFDSINRSNGKLVVRMGDDPLQRSIAFENLVPLVEGERDDPDGGTNEDEGGHGLLDKILQKI